MARWHGGGDEENFPKVMIYYSAIEVSWIPFVNQLSIEYKLKIVLLHSKSRANEVEFLAVSPPTKSRARLIFWTVGPSYWTVGASYGTAKKSRANEVRFLAISPPTKKLCASYFLDSWPIIVVESVSVYLICGCVLDGLPYLSQKIFAIMVRFVIVFLVFVCCADILLPTGRGGYLDSRNIHHDQLWPFFPIFCTKCTLLPNLGTCLNAF